ncbi:transposase [Streptomyces hyaluromycini]|uniref:Transposase n=1 Tax=Streptomyces hyaluromycini TaxID=1377993 RepID=A0ABV1X8V9_9ACTN
MSSSSATRRRPSGPTCIPWPTVSPGPPRTAPPLGRSRAAPVYLDQRGRKAAPTPGNDGRRSQGTGPPAWLRQRPRLRRQDSSRQASAGRVGARPPSANAVTCWILTRPDALSENDRLRLKAVLVNCPELAALTVHVRSFAHMLTQLQGGQLPEWIEAATATAELPSLRRFAQHLERDLDAAIAGLSHPRNPGAVEGHVNRIEMLKRQMFGREGFELLRRRVLLP